MPGSHMIPTRESPGTISRRSSSRLPVSSEVKPARPVTFPPGRARLATKPAPTGSALAVTTIGIVRVCRLIAAVASSTDVTIRSTFRRTRSAARSASLSGLASPSGARRRVSLPRTRALAGLGRTPRRPGRQWPECRYRERQSGQSSSKTPRSQGTCQSTAPATPPTNSRRSGTKSSPVERRVDSTTRRGGDESTTAVAAGRCL